MDFPPSSPPPRTGRGRKRRLPGVPDKTRRKDLHVGSSTSFLTGKYWKSQRFCVLFPNHYYYDLKKTAHLFLRYFISAIYWPLLNRVTRIEWGVMLCQSTLWATRVHVLKKRSSTTNLIYSTWFHEWGWNITESSRWVRHLQGDHLFRLSNHSAFLSPSDFFSLYLYNQSCHFLFAKEVTSLSHRKQDDFSSLNLINIFVCLQFR